MAESLRPQWFVTRQNGSMVPLVAMDELPSTVNIPDVPRRLSPHDIQGMTGLGTHNTRHKQYAVNGNQRSFPPEKSLMQSAFASPGQPFPQMADYTPTPPTTPGPSPSSPDSSKVTTIPEIASPPSIGSPDPQIYNKERVAQLKGEGGSYRRLDTIPAAPRRVKEYCSYWLRHGECDYAQQGCLYRHEMPLEPEVLARLGLRDIPRWYREKHGLVSYLSGNTSVGIEENKRPDILNTNWRTLAAQSSARDDFNRRAQSFNAGRFGTPQPRRLPHFPSNRVIQQPPRPGGLYNSRYASPFPTPPRAPPVAPLSIRRARAAAAANHDRASLDTPLPRGALTNFPPLIPDLEESAPSSTSVSKPSSTITTSPTLTTTTTTTSIPTTSPTSTSKRNKTSIARPIVVAALTGPSKNIAAAAATTAAAADATSTADASETNTARKGQSRGSHGRARRKAAAKAREQAAKDKLTTMASSEGRTHQPKAHAASTSSFGEKNKRPAVDGNNVGPASIKEGKKVTALEAKEIRAPAAAAAEGKEGKANVSVVVEKAKKD